MTARIDVDALERDLKRKTELIRSLSNSIELMAPIAAYYSALLVAFGDHPSLQAQWDGLMVSMKLINPEFDALVLEIISSPNFDKIMKTIAASNKVPHDQNFPDSSYS